MDPFGKTATRRLERTLAEWYRSVVRRALPHLYSAPDAVGELVAAPEAIRGYESLKQSTAASVMKDVDDLLRGLETPSPQPVD
jgi:hypothetical protein